MVWSYIGGDKFWELLRFVGTSDEARYVGSQVGKGGRDRLESVLELGDVGESRT